MMAVWRIRQKIIRTVGGTENAGVENAGVEISARRSRKRQGVENAEVEIAAR